MQFWQPRHFFRQKVEDFLLVVRNKRSVELSRKKILFIKLFPLTKRMQFWRSQRGILDKAQEIFCSMSEIDRMTFLSKKLLFLKWFLCTWKCRFDNPAETFSTNGRKFCAQCPKILRKISFLSKKNIFSSKCIFGRFEISSDNPIENFQEQAEKMWLNVRPWQKKLKPSSELFLSLEKLICTGELQFSRPRHVFSYKNLTIFCSTSRSFGRKVKKRFRSISADCEFSFFPTKEIFFFHQDVLMFK